jgi:carbonic anhydrase
VKKLIRGILEFRRKTLPEQRETFARLALGQKPDALMVACSDSRVAPNVFASTEPGDLFVVRNVGNLIAPCGEDGLSTHDESEGAAVEFALLTLPVTDVIVCGHSSCGAMKALLDGRLPPGTPNLASWLRHGRRALDALATQSAMDPALPREDQLSQQNVLEQLSNLHSYPVVRERLAAGRLRVHGWWFDIKTASVHVYEPAVRRFVPLDEAAAETILARLDGRG